MLLRSARNQSADWKPFLVGLAIAALLGALLAAIAAFLLARAVARPVTRVADASRRLAEGEDPDPLPVEGSTEVRQLSTAFNELSEELHRAQDAERAFLLSVSHELKTPLTAIRGHAEGLADGVVSRGAGRRGDRAGGAAARAADPRPPRPRPPAPALVRRHARSGRPRRGRQRSRRPPRLASRGLRRRPRAPRRSIRRARSPTRVARCRPSRIWSRTRSAALRGAARSRSWPHPASCRCSTTAPVSQTSDLEHAFERFYLWDRYGADRPVGTGLGLAIVAELAAAMGGRVTVESTPGAGSAFTLELAPATLPDRTAYVRLTPR